ncbi:MAG: hypothetical protein KDK45_05800, partial [Leptospiraceae bacterium]|nr:hypothetical protein [Leptospiraceae bacterium]
RFLAPSSSLQLEAQKHRLTDFSRVRYNEPESIKSELLDKNAVVAGILVDEGFLNHRGNEVIRETKGKFIGAHALAIVGFDDTKKAFKIQNSWSESWGDKGYAYLDYKYFAKICRSAYSLEIQNSPSLPKSSPTKIKKFPEEIYASRGNFTDRIILHWEQIPEAFGYEIYRADPGQSMFEKIGTSIQNRYEDTGILSGLAFRYRLKAIFEDGKSPLSESFVSGYAEKKKRSEGMEVQGLRASQGEFRNQIILRWKKVKTASEYEVFKWNDKKKVYLSIGKTSKTKFIDKKLKKGGDTGIYCIGAIEKGKTGILSKAVIGYSLTEEIPPAPEKLSASKGEFSDKILIHWSKVPTASAYLVYRFVKGNWEKLGVVEQEIFEDKNPPSGKVFYAVAAKSKTGSWGEYSSSIAGFTNPALKRNSISLKQASRLSMKYKAEELHFTWKKETEAVSYTIFQKIPSESNWEKVVTVDSKTLSYTHKLPAKEKLYLYSISYSNRDGIESQASLPLAFVDSEPKKTDFVMNRAFAKISLLEKFKGTWTAVQWDGKNAFTNVVLKIDSEEDNSLYKINIGSKNSYKGEYVEGSPTLEVEDKLKVNLSYTEDSLIVEMKDENLVKEKTELSFLRE